MRSDAFRFFVKLGAVLTIRWGTTVQNRRVPISVFMGTLATDDQDNKELTANWEFLVFREYRMGDWHENVMRPTCSL